MAEITAINKNDIIMEKEELLIFILLNKKVTIV